METLTRKSERLQVPNPQFYERVVRYIARPLLTKKWGYDQIGNENIPAADSGPYVIAPVHRAHVDPGVVAFALRNAGSSDQIHWLAKKELWDDSKLPLFKMFGKGFGNLRPLSQRIFNAGGAYPVDRDLSLEDQPGLMSHIDQVVAGRGVLGIFPEGTRKSGDLVEPKSVKRGVALIALKHQLPILPVGVVGTHKSDRGPVYVAFGQLIQPSEIDVDFGNPREMVRLARPVLHELVDNINDAQQRAIRGRGGL